MTGRTRSRIRLPDFIIVGAMKSGTTTLYRWLGEQPEIVLPQDKEPDFFSADRAWGRGLDWYGRLFADIPPTRLTGEASVSYTDPAVAERAARRMAATVPGVRLIYLVRNPLERLRSHYRHEVQRGRESRPFLEAVGATGNPYVARSCYFTCLAPYLEAFPEDRILVVRLEDLSADPSSGWTSVLAHLDLPARSPPATVHNVTADKPRYTRLMLALWESGLLDPLTRLPGPLRRLGKRLLLRRDPTYLQHLAEADAPIPPQVAASVWEDVSRLEARLGRALWDRRQDGAVPAEGGTP